MIIYLAGDIYGKISNFYHKVLQIEDATKLTPAWILHTGNFGIFPDPIRVDRQTRLRGEADFPSLYHQKVQVPKKTLFVAGKHEDHAWLDLKYSRGEMELLSGLHWLVNGFKTFIGDEDKNLSIVGLGKVFSPTTYRLTGAKNKKTKSHYSRNEIEKACTQGPTNILLTHQAGHGERIGKFISDSQGIQKIIYAIRPKLHVHGGYNISQEYINQQGVPSISLASNEIKIIEWNSVENQSMNNMFRIIESFI